METQTIAHTEIQTKPEIPDIRLQRGAALFRADSSAIWQLAPHTYRVPSESDENTVYIVRIRKGFEFCPCEDHAETGECCEHIHAAKTWKLHSDECADCKVRLLGYKLHLVGEDHPTFHADDELCKDCALKAGVR